MKELRERLQMTQAQIAEALGISTRTVATYEAGAEPPKAIRLACRWLEYAATANAPSPADDDAPLSATTEARLNAMEARLGAIEKAIMPRQPRFAPDVQALQDRMDADLEARRLAKLAELEAQEADQATVVPMNPYRPAPLTPAEEAARKARRAAAKAAHIANGEPWDE